VEDDGSPESFFQLAMFRVLAEQFYLLWHGKYRDLNPVSTPEGMLHLAEKGAERGDVKDAFDFQAAARRNLAPYVLLDAYTATISFVAFTKWGGLSRYAWTVKRSFPHQELTLEKRELIPYQHGTRF
jgi:hypothetical protein